MDNTTAIGRKGKEADALTVSACVLGITTLVLSAFKISQFGEMKLYWFLLGVFALATSVLFAAVVARGNKWGWFNIVSFIAGSLYCFSKAIP